MVLLSEHGALPRLDAAIFADTQSEPQYVYDTLAWLEAATSIPILRVSAGNLGADILAGIQGGRETAVIYQPPFWVKNAASTDALSPTVGGRLRRKCTNIYKIAPIRRKIRELLGVNPFGRLPRALRVEQWIGFPADEMARTFCSDVQWIVNIFPLILPLRMRKRDCEAWLRTHGYPIPQKSSCTFCPYHSNAYWRTMRAERPDEWKAAVDFERQLHTGRLPGVRGQVYLHRALVPLDQAPIGQDEGTPALFCLACAT
jgi:hypothetical protein